MPRPHKLLELQELEATMAARMVWMLLVTAGGEALAGESNVQFVPQKPYRNEVDCPGAGDFGHLLLRLHQLTVASVAFQDDVSLFHRLPTVRQKQSSAEARQIHRNGFGKSFCPAL